MNDNVVIVAINNTKILVQPLLTGACVNCEKSSCAKRGKTFQVENPKNFPISVGSVVKIKTNRSVQIFQGFAALIFPILSAVACYFLGSYLAAKFGWQKVEMTKALSSLIGLLVVSLTVFCINAKSHNLQRSEISEVVSA